VIHEGQTKVRVTIWQPYFAGRMLAFGASNLETLELLERDTELQREIFTWPVAEDVWAGIVDDDARTRLRDKFINDFQPMVTPAARSMSRLGAFVEELKTVAYSNASDWSTSETGAPESNETSFMINAGLAFYHHLAWMHEVFADVPGASVSVR